MIHKQAADGGIFCRIAFVCLGGSHDVELPASQVGSKAHVLTAASDGERELVFGNDDIDGVFVFVDDDAADFGG